MFYKNFQNDPSIRLAKYKASEAKLKERYPDSAPSFYSWRNKSNRYPKPNVLSRKSSLTRSEDGQRFFIDSLDEWTAGDHQDAHEVAKLDHTGWYADNFQDGLIRGAVVSFRNPHKINPEFENDNCYWVDDFKSHVFYLPATYGTNYDGATVHNEIYYSAKDCAYRADQLAEREAEEEREHDAQFQAELQIEEAKKELHELNRETLEVIHELKQNSTVDLFDGKKALCRVIREHIEDALEQRTELFKKIEELKNNPWAAVENY